MKFGVSLNPKKCHFSLEGGKLLGNIILKDGIRIDPTKLRKLLYQGGEGKCSHSLGRLTFLEGSVLIVQIS